MSSNQLWKLNKYLVCKLHLLPKINDVLQKFEGYKYASAIDLSMGYYHIPLEEYSQSLCGTIMPWGLCQCKVVPMGISNAPDIFQSTMATLLGNLSYILEYIDNILITSNPPLPIACNRFTQSYNNLNVLGLRPTCKSAALQPNT